MDLDRSSRRRSSTSSGFSFSALANCTEQHRGHHWPSVFKFWCQVVNKDTFQTFVCVHHAVGLKKKAKPSQKYNPHKQQKQKNREKDTEHFSGIRQDQSGYCSGRWDQPWPTHTATVQPSPPPPPFVNERPRLHKKSVELLLEWCPTDVGKAFQIRVVWEKKKQTKNPHWF